MCWALCDCLNQRACTRVHAQHTCTHVHHPAVTFLVPGQEPGAGDAGGTVGWCVGPAGELVEGAVTDQLCGGTDVAVPWHHLRRAWAPAPC